MDDLGHTLHLGAFADLDPAPAPESAGVERQAAILAGANCGRLGPRSDAPATRADGDALLKALLDAARGLPARRLRLIQTGSGTAIRARVHGQERHLAQIGAPAFDSVLRALRRRGRRHAQAGLRFALLPLTEGGQVLSLEIESADPPRALADLGFQAADRETFERVLALPQGLVLSAGPADSGRSSTLRALLAGVDAQTRSVLVFAPGTATPGSEWLSVPARRRGDATPELAQLLRFAPDVLLYDAPLSTASARMLLQAATRGCLVLAALSAERAHHAFLSFRAFGVAPRELATPLALVIAQRLARTLCAACAEADLSEEVRRATAQAANSWLAGVPLRPARSRPGGCARCANLGGSSRLLLYECLEVDGGVRAMAEDEAVGVEMEQLLLSAGRGIWDHGLRHLAEGRLSLAALRAAVRDTA